VSSASLALCKSGICGDVVAKMELLADRPRHIFSLAKSVRRLIVEDKEWRDADPFDIETAGDNSNDECEGDE
jgi:hypothetical protein